MFKFACTTFLGLCIIYGSCGASTTARIVDTDEKSNNISEVWQKVSTEMEQSIENIPKAIQWAFSHLQLTAENLFSDVTSSLTCWLVGFMIRIELVTMADPDLPSHFIFPLQNGNLEKQHRVFAKAVVGMWMDLSTMEKTDKMLVKVTEDTASQVLRKKMIAFVKVDNNDETKLIQEMFSRFSKEIFKNLEDAMKADENLGPIYMDRKIEAEKIIKLEPKMAGPSITFDRPSDFKSNSEKTTQKMIAMFKRSFVRKLLVNKMFIIQASKRICLIFSESAYNHYVLARSLLEFAANEAKTERANKLYQEVLSQVSQDLIVDSVDEGESNDSKILENLSNEIRSKLLSDPTMVAEVNLLQSKISKNTVWDSEMFSIRILPF